MTDRHNKPPKLAALLLTRMIDKNIRYGAMGDFEEQARAIYREYGAVKARIYWWAQVFAALPGFIHHSFYWSVAMLRHNLKTTSRHIRKNKGYSLINILGLSIGMTCALYVMMFVRFERSYDDYHPDPDSIFRVAMEFKTRTTESLEAMTYSPMRNVFKEQFPAVAYAARVRHGTEPLVKHEDRVFYETQQMWTDTDLFHIFSIPFIVGDPSTALDRLGTVVIARRIAQKYFLSTDVLGRVLEIDGNAYEITGVVEDCPRNTHLKYELFHSFRDFESERWTRSWTANMAYNYIKLHAGADRPAFEEQIRRISDPYSGQRDRELGYSRHYFLQRIRDIHLFSHMREETEPPGNPLYLVICSAVGVLILLIACLNFVNLSTALSAHRAKEVGMRKVVGAQRRQLMMQFLGDALVFSTLALVVSFILANVLLTTFNQLSGMMFRISDILSLDVLLPLVGLAVGIGLVAGCYPAIFLSRFKPVSTLRGTLRSGVRGGTLRRILVVGQFTISIILIVCTLMVYRQLGFMKNQNLGFQPEQKLVIPMRGGVTIEDNYEAIKYELTQHPNVTGAAASAYIMGTSFDTQYIYRMNAVDDRRQVVNHLYIDTDFIPLYGIDMAAGRSFQKEMHTDSEDAVIINETAVEALGFLTPQEAVGQQVESGPDGNIRIIVGVTEDFHYKGLASEIQPIVLKIYPPRFYNITLSVKTDDLQKTLFFVDRKLNELFPDNPLHHFFLDTFFNRQYQKEEQVGRLFGMLSCLGLSIAALGLLGLISFTAVQRTKEIGIRKVLGSSVVGIIALLTRDFTRLVLLSNLIAWPVAYFLIRRWLVQFPYRTAIGLDVFFLSGMLVLIVAVVSVGYQSVKAALTNPVDSLKYE